MKKIIAILVGAVMAALFAAAPANAQDDATIMLLHGIPDTDVDVIAGGEAAIEGFSFGDMQDLSALAGQTLPGLQVVVAGTDTVAIDAGDVALPAAGNFTIVAHLDAEGTPTISVFENDTSSTAAGEGRIVVRHTAAAPEVDVLANGAVAFAAVPNGAEGQVDLAAGTITAEVVPAGASEPVVIGPADLPVTEGASLIVYAVGSLEAGNLSVLTQSISGLQSAPETVNTGNSPVSDSASNAGLVVAAAIGLGVLGLGGARLATRRG